MTYAQYGYYQGTWASAPRPMEAGIGRMAEMAMHRNDRFDRASAASAETRMAEKFNTMDADGDGMISKAEFADATMPKPPAPPPISEDQSIRAILQGILAELQAMRTNEATVTEAAPMVGADKSVAADTPAAETVLPEDPAKDMQEVMPKDEMPTEVKATPADAPSVGTAPATDMPGKPAAPEVQDPVPTTAPVTAEAAEAASAEAATAVAATETAVSADQTTPDFVATSVTDTATDDRIEDQFETLIDLLEDGEETGTYASRLSEYVENLYVDVQTILDAA